MPRRRDGSKMSVKSYRKMIDSYTPKSGGTGPSGNLATTLREHVRDGEQVSVEDSANPHKDHHDATLYQRDGGKFHTVDKAHLGKDGKEIGK